MRQHSNMLCKQTDGSVAVEFALVLFPLILFIVGALETARFFWINNAMEAIAVDTARCMALRAPECSSNGEDVNFAQAMVNIQDDATKMGINLPSSSITLSDDAVCAGLPGFSSVSIRHEFPSVFILYVDFPMQADACFPNQIR